LGYARGMCREPFEEGQLIYVDHDHGCCRAKNRSCGKGVRGLLCHGCNIALGHIEHRNAMARAYLDGAAPVGDTPSMKGPRSEPWCKSGTSDGGELHG
jgi:hypothetical protein